MGIINLTPDSFYDGGSNNTPEAVLNKASAMIGEGASIIDIGALSTRPGAMQLTDYDELDRLIPYLNLIRKEFPKIIISVDTYRRKVAEAAINGGADMINDISGGLMDNEMINYMCQHDAAYVLMHIQGTPENMQLNPQYSDVVKEVKAFFTERLKIFTEAGKQNIILDPGFGFGKTVRHNYQLLNGIAKLTEVGYPVLAGVSRKSMINKVLNTKPESALNGTTAVNTIALMQGASILRVHDVKEAMQTVKIFMEYKNSLPA